jgi:hypothetical protein
VTSIYNRHDYMKERRLALQTWADSLSDMTKCG